MDVGFKRIKWLKSRSPYQDMVYHRERRAKFNKKHQATMDAANAAMSNAQHNKVSGQMTLAAQASLKRVQEMAKAKADELTKQIDNAQSLVEQAEASGTSSTDSTNTVDTVV